MYRQRERVKAGAAIVLRLTPLAFDPAPALKTIDGGVEGTLQDFEALAGDLLDAQQGAVTMQRTQRDRLEDEHLECALREFNRFRQRALSYLEKESTRSLLSRQGDCHPGDCVFGGFSLIRSRGLRFLHVNC